MERWTQVRTFSEGRYPSVMEGFNTRRRTNGSTAYITGSFVDCLYDYEELGYTPNELRILLEQRDNLEDLADNATSLLQEYEALEFTPEELRNIIDKYEQLKRIATSPSGLTRKGSPDDWKEFVKHAIDRASKDKNVSVSVFFRENDVSVSVYPWPEEDESDDNG